MEPFLGMIALFGFNFPPRGWALCQGQMLPISTNAALFSLLGTTYGGNGQNTFQLPDLRGRVPIGYGQGNGLPDYNIGQTGGEAAVTLVVPQMPQHSHVAVATSTSTLNGENTPGTGALPQNHFLAGSGAAAKIYAPAAGTPAAMATGSVTTATTVTVSPMGGSLPHDNMQPYVAMNYCIALQGVFPSRN